VQAACFFTPRLGAEVVFTQQASALAAGTSSRAADFYDITLPQLQANVVYQFGGDRARVQPFVVGGVGATFFAASDLDSQAKAAFGFGSGFKYFPWASVGLRGQFRYTPTWLHDDPAGGFWDPFGFCQEWLQQIDITAGVIIRF
jgi:opacity protein-like surface antigen